MSSTSSSFIRSRLLLDTRAMFNHIQIICPFMNTLPVLCFPFKGFCRFKFLVIPLIILSYTFYWKQENIWSCVLVTIYIIVLVLQGVVSECMKLSYLSPTEEKWHFFPWVKNPNKILTRANNKIYWSFHY